MGDAIRIGPLWIKFIYWKDGFLMQEPKIKDDSKRLAKERELKRKLCKVSISDQNDPLMVFWPYLIVGRSNQGDSCAIGKLTRRATTP